MRYEEELAKIMNARRQGKPNPFWPAIGLQEGLGQIKDLKG